MIDKELQSEILESITKFGKSEEKTIMINTNISDILNFSSGSPRLQSTAARKARLILSKPQSLQVLNNFQIRCILCHKVISYPCWYYNIRYAINHFHYFVCFDSDSSTKPSTRCYRRDV